MLGEELAGWLGPQCGGEWYRIQSVANYKWGSPGFSIGASPVLIKLLMMWTQRLGAPPVSLRTTPSWEEVLVCWRVEIFVEGSGQAGSMGRGQLCGVQ